MKGMKKILFGLLVNLILIQFIQPPRNKSGQAMPKDISKTIFVPVDVQVIPKKALNFHTRSGKAELNFNEIGSYNPQRQRNKLHSIEMLF
ncbi:hypothetical protein AAKU52_001923 [Pedobacter sp. CG_S7]|uniref:hypothetical protein n=1 Tax=Pedobacter sp. CG_S7 TaxID=3143930 RepID=UPI003390D26A